jgi:hypothetical protein
MNGVLTERLKGFKRVPPSLMDSACARDIERQEECLNTFILIQRPDADIGNRPGKTVGVSAPNGRNLKLAEDAAKSAR